MRGIIDIKFLSAFNVSSDCSWLGSKPIPVKAMPNINTAIPIAPFWANVINP